LRMLCEQHSLRIKRIQSNFQERERHVVTSRE
jgi:hypothetical protein